MKSIIWCGLSTSKCSGKPHQSTTLLMTGHLIWRRPHCAWACHSIVNLNPSHIYRCIMQPCMQINSGKILQHQQPRYSATRAISFKGGRESVRTLRHNHQMKALVPARPSKSISSNFQKMNSFGDAICLSIACGHGAQVRSSSCSISHDMSQASWFTWALLTLHCCTAKWSEIYLYIDIQHTGFLRKLHRKCGRNIWHHVYCGWPTAWIKILR